METISLTDLKRMSGITIKTHLPLQVTMEGEATFVFEHVDNVITLSDLHPRIQTMLRAIERKARLGMPKAEQLYMREPAHNRD